MRFFMRFFSPDYNKPGTGVDENAPQKRRFFMFFELFFRKFGKLMQLNLLYLVTAIPAFIILFFLGIVVLNPYLETLAYTLPQIGVDPDIVIIMINVFFPLLIICLFGAGPTTAGFVYVIRNFSREEHSWLLSDFWEHTRKNFKQSLCVFIIDLAVIYFTAVAVNFYLERSMLPVAAMLVFFVIYILARLYIYPMMVTFDLPVRGLYRNAFIFAVMRLLPNVIIAVFIAAILIAVFLHIYAIILAVALILFSLCGYISVFWTFPSIERYMMNQEEQNK